MSKKKTETTIDLPPTWEEMREGIVVAQPNGGWSAEELGEAWGKCQHATLKALRQKGWVCVGKRSDVTISNAVKHVPLYAPKE